MCGITGFADYYNKSSQENVANMASAMSHRGPDGQGVFFEQQNGFQVGLGHRRLSIIDLSNEANQPMYYKDYIIVFNGEVYNYIELREELIQMGHNFQTHSDTEVILHCWEEWGEKSIEKWHGMFAMAIFDRLSGELICIRDRAGVKPLYYYHHEGLFLFGSELKTLMAHPAFEKMIDNTALVLFLQYGCVPAPYSIFRNTFKLHAGHLLRLNLRSRRLQVKQYWNVYDYYNKPKLKISLTDAIRETQRILERSFKYRMVADVPVGVFLSGGYDSTCVTALLQKNSSEKIKTFTIGSTDNKLDEAPFAKGIADHLGTDHTEYYCSASEALEIIPDLPFYYDEPFADSSAIPTILVSRLARQKVTVALSADAGDEIFAGYERYDYLKKYTDRIASIPAPLRKIAAGLMVAMPTDKIPLLKNRPNFENRYQKLRNLLNDPSPSELLKNLNIAFSDEAVQQLVKVSGIPVKTLYTSRELKPEYYDALSFMMAIDYQTYLADDILQKVDRAAMSISLEGREPFLDQDIIEWAARLPSEYKYYNGTKKYILREIVHQYIPEAMLNRPKMGFGIPVKQWLSHELKDLLSVYLNEKALAKHGLFDHEEIMKIMKAFEQGRIEHYLKIWYLLMFQMWHQRWM